MPFDLTKTGLERFVETQDHVYDIVAGLSLFYALIVFYMHSIAQRVLEGTLSQRHP